MTDASIEVQYTDRVKHTLSHYHTNDAELAFALTIDGTAEHIEITTKDDSTTVLVYTVDGVYHFSTFRADYVGHASRTLVQMLEHFGIRLPLEFVVAHQSFTIYITGKKIVASDKEYAIERRSDTFELVEPVELLISSAILDVVLQLSERFEVQPVEIIESAMGLFYATLGLAEQYQVSVDDIMTTITSMTAHRVAVASDDSALEPSTSHGASEPC